MDTGNKPATVLPWKVSHRAVCKDGNAKPLATTQRADDAAYIVTACNAYPQLVAALRETLDFADYVANNGNAAAHDAAKTARALLRAIGEE